MRCTLDAKCYNRIAGKDTIKNRRVDIDFVRAIAIVSVIAYHIGIQSSFMKYFTSFHMELFFVLSGYCTVSKEESIQKLLLRKAKSLLYPYVVFSLINFVLNIVLNYIYGVKLSALDYLKNLVFSHLSLGAIWFLLALFISSSLYGVLLLKMKSKMVIILCSIGISVLGFVGGHIGIRNCFRWEQGFFCVIFILLGHLLGDFERMIGFYSNHKYIVVRLLNCGVVGVVTYWINGYAQLSRFSIGNPIMFIISVVTCTIAWLDFCSLLVELLEKINCFKILNYATLMGRESLVVLCTHQILIVLFRKLFKSLDMAQLLTLVAVIFVEAILCAKKRVIKFLFCFPNFRIKH